MITIGAESWQRETDGSWTPRPAREGIEDQLRVFLPHAGTVIGLWFRHDEERAVLSWTTAAADADVTLTVDPETGWSCAAWRVRRARC
jgi:hypothetical protein